MAERVAILGASNNPERYAYKAYRMLRLHGHQPVLVHPTLKDVEGTPVFPNLGAIDKPIDTLTMYVGAQISKDLKDDILALKPKRVIFNPGSENVELENTLIKAGIEVMNACTLVMLSTRVF